MAKDTDLVGIWEKITSSPCSRAYPRRLEFRENKLYFGHVDTPGAFAMWDAGTFELVDDRQMRLSTANDAVVGYRFSLSSDVLTFVDPQNCEFKYRRAR